MSGTMDKPIVDIGVACNFAQSYQWWVSVMNLVLNESRWGDVTINAIRTVGSALPDHNKNNVIGNFVKRNALTDTNRTEVVKGFLDGRAEVIHARREECLVEQRQAVRAVEVAQHRILEVQSQVI